MARVEVGRQGAIEMRHYIKLEFFVETGIETKKTLANLYRIIVHEEIPGLDSKVEVLIDEDRM